MEQGTPWLALGRRQDRVWGAMRRRRLASHGREPSGMERLDGVAHGLIVAAQGLGDDAGVLAMRAGQQHLAAAHHKRIGRPSTLLKGMLFGGAEGTDLDGLFHAQ